MVPARPEAEAAQKQLRRLFDALASERGEAPTFDCFYPVDVERLIADLQWRVTVVDDPAYIGPFAKAHALADPASRTIFLAKTEVAERRRFTLAHELGHIILHPGTTLARSSPRPTSARQSVRPPIDRELEPLEVAANKFAAQLLMPAKAIGRVFQEHFGSPFVIPEEAVRILGCESTRDRFQLSQRLSRWSAADKVSICARFGVSANAAGRRLLELDLLA